MEGIKNDLVTLGLYVTKVESLTVIEAKLAYHKKAKLTHPDKVGPKCTTQFQELGNAYQRILKYIIENLQSKMKDTTPVVNDEDIFVRDNFGKFNFPFENQGSFTVNVEDSLAEVWQDCLENGYGSPRIIKNSDGTEVDRIWKIRYGLGEESIEITLHFYNHNKTKDKKTSKILIQGSS